jgi:outer membrane protein, heavy metal efflux system
MAMAACVVPAFADHQPTPAELPPTVMARQWIDQDPAVQEARSALVAAGHTAAMLTASPNEWSSKFSLQRRSYSGADADSKEWSAQLERPIRINGKADFDRQLGETELQIAQARVGEAMHEAARLLLDLWMDALAAAQTEKLLTEQQSFARFNLQAVQSRKKAGDASQLDVSVATADLADVQRQASLAASNLAKARAKLRVRFPGAQLLTQTMGEPLPPAVPEAQWLQRVLKTADPLQIAQGQLRKAQLTASRANADRVPDPTIGIYAAAEASRKERIVGISLSIPLGGSYRKERVSQALQEVEVARAGVQRQERELQSKVAESYADATGHLTRWKLAEQGATATAESTRLSQRAYTLGEADLQSLLVARRQLLEASRAVLDARIEALRANYRLLVDAHLIWDLEHE